MDRAVELLAPAGSIDSMKAAFSAGADAVYIGGSMFGARAYADNPDTDELLWAIDYAHIREKKLYMTVNTLLKDQEIEEKLYDYIRPFYEQGLDAAIVQDFGVLHFLKANFPDLHIHASTQMTVTGVYSAKILEKLGVQRVVTARELSLKELSEIRKQTSLEIESFVHGAMCYSYSGQCLFSSLAGGRSGNRGRCAQPCRKPYMVYDEDGRLLNPEKSRQYVLSLKDMNTVRILPEIIKAGVDSLKIEGRMKKPEYTAGVVSIYRKYLDRYLSGQEAGVSDEDYRRLFDLFNRNGFSEGYYMNHNGKNMITMSEPQFRAHDDKWQQDIRENYIEKELKRKIKGNVTIYQYLPATMSLTSGQISSVVLGEEPAQAQNRPLDALQVRKQLGKFGGTDFELSELSVDLGDNCFLTVGQMNELRRAAISQMRDSILKTYKRTAVEKKKISRKEAVIHDESFFTAQVHTAQQLEAVLLEEKIKRVYLDSGMFSFDKLDNAVKLVHSSEKECYFVMPQIFRVTQENLFARNIVFLREAGFDGFLCSSLEAVEFLSEKGFTNICGDHSLYAMNSQARIQLAQLGVLHSTYSVELNEEELINLGGNQEMIVYGRLPMMITANCLCNTITGCKKSEGVPEHLFYMSDDTGRRFPVICSCTNCMNIIYNCEPLYLLDFTRKLDRIAPESMRLIFTIENRNETESVLSGLHGKHKVTHFTRGHLKRGVE